MGVFTTQTLLNSVGVSKHRATPGAIAINWILKVQIESSSLFQQVPDTKKLLATCFFLTFYLKLGLDIRMWK